MKRGRRSPSFARAVEEMTWGKIDNCEIMQLPLPPRRPRYSGNLAHDEAFELHEREVTCEQKEEGERITKVVVDSGLTILKANGEVWERNEFNWIYVSERLL